MRLSRQIYQVQVRVVTVPLSPERMIRWRAAMGLIWRQLLAREET